MQNEPGPQPDLGKAPGVPIRRQVMYPITLPLHTDLPRSRPDARRSNRGDVGQGAQRWWHRVRSPIHSPKVIALDARFA